uniref:Cytochrome P450 n=1 Tax=Ditylenchus dipsaci TaxID=166011 RepID=A0A915DHF8_9BILA
MFPAVPIIGRKIVEDTDICEGSKVLSQPDKFDPDHFSPELVRTRNPFANIPFSAGPRNCIGQKFAVTEQRIVLAKIFRRYKIITVMHELENRGLPELILKPSHGFVVRVERR